MTEGRHLLKDRAHRSWLWSDALQQFDFFRKSLNPAGGFRVLGHNGQPLDNPIQELHTTTRMIHSYALGKLANISDVDAIIDQGMAYLWNTHRDPDHGGYYWSVEAGLPKDDRKLAYGHVFVLLASASAKIAGHPEADRLIADVSTILDRHFWEEDAGLFCDEWNRDWTPFSEYRGMNANMHGVEALLTAFEATDNEIYLNRAGRILDFFIGKIAPQENWRLPEHYTANWSIDQNYSGNPMFRPAGTTPGHSFELARLLLQYHDLRGNLHSDIIATSRKLVYQALRDAWLINRGGLVYTLNFDGTQANTSRYWWPVTEAIGVLASLIKLDPQPLDDRWYRQLWDFALTHFVDHIAGGWFPEIDSSNRPCAKQFAGKPDIYHSVQAVLFPLTDGVSRFSEGLKRLRPNTLHL
jgi:mannose/cellobiose epimerase-like protein (N-acyl-D-glucosamine 2-epimerase family)